MLADMGAEVVKLEPPSGDTYREVGPELNGTSIPYAQQNCGKRNICLDLATAEGRALAARLAESADAIVENFRPGVMEKLGLGYPGLRERNPGLVYASISGYGQTGPWAHRGAYATMVHAEMGYLEADARYSGRATEHEPYAHADVYSGLNCLAALLAALYQRERTGVGQRVEVSMAESVLAANEYSAVCLNGLDEERPLFTSASPIFSAPDGTEISVAGDPVLTFPAWTRAMGTPELLDDARFADRESRSMNRRALFDLLQAWILEQPSVGSLEQTLASARLIVASVRSVVDAGNSEWARERGAVAEIDMEGGNLRIANSPWRFSAGITGPRAGVARRGEHNSGVLRDWLGMVEPEVQRLTTDGVLRGGF